MTFSQDNFIKRVTSKYTLKTLPHSIILLGDDGSGHNYVCQELADYYGLMFYDISTMITREYIDQIYLGSNPTLYVVDLSKIAEKEQNILLKLFEEPKEFTYIILYGESLYNVLDTIQSRGHILYLDKYSKEFLSEIANHENRDLILSLCTTPGQVDIANHTDLAGIQTLCSNMISKMSQAGFANTLTITDKINFSDEYSKYDLRLFIKMLGQQLAMQGKLEDYRLLHHMAENIIYMNDKKSYFDNFLIKMWKRCHQ